MKTWLFWVAWGFDALVALGFVYFFMVGLSDGTVSSFNAGLWASILIGLAGVLIGSYLLRAKGFLVFAFLLLGLLALPAFGFVLMMAVVILSGERMN